MLTEYSVLTRYSGVGAEVSSEEAAKAVEIADTVYETVRRTLSDAGFAL